MKKFFFYLFAVIFSTILLWIISVKYGITTIEVNCPPKVMDCGNATGYSPFFWFPMKFLRTSAVTHILLQLGQVLVIKEVQCLFFHLFIGLYWQTFLLFPFIKYFPQTENLNSGFQYNI